MLRWLWGLCLVGCTGETWIESVGINELMAADPEGEWVELHNVTDAPVDLEGWSLEVDGVSMELNGEVPAGGFFAVDLQLVDAGGMVSLIEPDGTVLDDVSFPEGDGLATFGRIPDAAPNWQVLGAPTPGDPNRR